MTFSEVVGMKELSDGKPRRIRNCKACPTQLYAVQYMCLTLVASVKVIFKKA